MLKNYLATALRNLARNKLYAGITIAGLSLGFAAAMLIALYVRDELSFDRFVPQHDRIYRVSETIQFTQERPIESDLTPLMIAPSLKLDFPQVAISARLTGIAFPPTVRHGAAVPGGMARSRFDTVSRRGRAAGAPRTRARAAGVASTFWRAPISRRLAQPDRPSATK